MAIHIGLTLRQALLDVLSELVIIITSAETENSQH